MNIIVVDDERILLKAESAMVKKVLPDAEVNAFCSSSAALDYAAANPIDLAILDINLGIVSGVELAARLRMMFPLLDVIFCTGYAELRQETEDISQSAYLMKPMSESRLQETIAALPRCRSA